MVGGTDPTTPAAPATPITAKDSETAPHPELPLARGATVGRFVVLDLLGFGGMGVVIAAYDPELDRRVAIKVLRPHPGMRELTVEQRARAVREAQAMAKLSHPNVITIYDAGAVDGTVFIAMELIDGGTLRERLVGIPRGPERWRRVLELMVPAGRGLAAAHAAGLVHRDFKPDNVLCGKDGRVCVTDFGLVAPASSVDRSSETPGDVGASATLRTSQLTRVGTVMGTPRYMAPEQRMGQPADARADQYAYCVALLEALGGNRAEEEAPTVRDAVAPATSRVRVDHCPPWLHAAIVRGLAPSPEDRYPSMDALLAELARDRARRRRRVAAAAGVVAIGGAIAASLALASSPAPAPCGGASRKLDGIWDAAVAGRVKAALTASGAPYAAATWAEVDRLLAGYSHAWVDAHIAACRATHVDHEQSEHVLDLRMQCLERRRSALAAATAQLVRPGAVDQAAQVAVGLPALADCANGALLAAPLALPDDAASRARIEAVRDRIDEAHARLRAGHPQDAWHLAAAAVADARAARHEPALAEALFVVGMAQDHAGDGAAAATTFREAAAVAETGHHDQLKADAWTELIQVESESLGRPGEAAAWVPLVKAAIDRLGGDPTRAASLEALQGQIAWRLGRYDEARTRLESSLATRITALGADHLDVAGAHNLLALVLRAQGDRDGAIEQHRKALAIRVRLGEQHPAVADSRTNLGVALQDAGRYADALAEHERALAIRLAIFGAEHLEVAAVRNNRAMVLLDLDRVAEAITEWETVISIYQVRLPDVHPLHAVAHNNLGLALTRAGRAADAVPHLRQALAARERDLPAGHVDIALTHGNLGHALLATGATAAGLAELAITADVLETALGPTHPRVSYWAGELGTALARAGRAPDALRACQRSLAASDEPIDQAYAHLCLGRAHMLLGDRAAAARVLAPAVTTLESSEESADDIAEARRLLSRARGFRLGARQ